MPLVEVSEDNFEGTYFSSVDPHNMRHDAGCFVSVVNDLKQKSNGGARNIEFNLFFSSPSEPDFYVMMVPEGNKIKNTVIAFSSPFGARNEKGNLEFISEVDAIVLSSYLPVERLISNLDWARHTMSVGGFSPLRQLIEDEFIEVSFYEYKSFNTPKLLKRAQVQFEKFQNTFGVEKLYLLCGREGEDEKHISFSEKYTSEELSELLNGAEFIAADVNDLPKLSKDFIDYQIETLSQESDSNIHAKIYSFGSNTTYHLPQDAIDDATSHSFILDFEVDPFDPDATSDLRTTFDFLSYEGGVSNPNDINYACNLLLHDHLEYFKALAKSGKLSAYTFEGEGFKETHNAYHKLTMWHLHYDFPKDKLYSIRESEDKEFTVLTYDELEKEYETNPLRKWI